MQTTETNMTTSPNDVGKHDVLRAISFVRNLLPFSGGKAFKQAKPIIQNILHMNEDLESLDDLVDYLIDDNNRLVEFFALLRDQTIDKSLKEKIIGKCINELKVKYYDKPDWILTEPNKKAIQVFVDFICSVSEEDYQTKVLPFMKFELEGDKLGRDYLSSIFTKNAGLDFEENLKAPKSQLSFYLDDYIPTEKFCTDRLTMSSYYPQAKPQIRNIQHKLRYAPKSLLMHTVRLGREGPCFCDSGKKFKHCHLKSEVGIAAEEVL